MIRIPGRRAGGMLGAGPQDFPGPHAACPAPGKAPVYNLDTASWYCVDEAEYSARSCYSTNETRVLAVSGGKMGCMPFDQVKKGGQSNPCEPGQELGYDFDQNRERCFAVGQCSDYDIALLTPGDRWVPVAYKNEPRLCMKQSDLNAGKKPCDVYAGYPVCGGSDSSVSTGEKVALGVAVVAILGLGYVALKDG